MTGVALLGLAPMLTGCFVTTQHVAVHAAPPVVLNATLDQLVAKIDTQFKAIHTLNAQVVISATTPGAKLGDVNVSTGFSGRIFVRKPQDLRVVLMVPVLSTRAMDMVSNGTDFTLYIPSKKKVIEGTNVVTNPSPNVLENLRPNVFLDALIVRDVGADEYVELSDSSRLVEPETKHRDAISEPDYDLTISKLRTGHMLARLRVIHFSRVDLEPYEQDVYDDAGRVVTTVKYSKYQKFGDLSFPTDIVIDRPLDHYSLKVTVQSLKPNRQIDDDQFEKDIPAGVAVEKLK